MKGVIFSYKRLSSTFLVFTAIVILAAGLSSFSAPPAAERYYTVASVGQQQIPAATKAKLLAAFRAQYGKNASVKEIKLVTKSNNHWLVFLGGGDGTPTVGIELTVINGNLSIDLGGPVAINNCNPKGNCSCCNTECACSKKNGGQDSCGSDACESVQTDELLPSAMKQVLQG